MNFAGPDLTLFIALNAAAAIKWAFSAKMHVRQLVGSLIAGFAIGYFGHEPLIRNLDVLTKDDAPWVAILLYLSSEQIVRFILGASPEKLWKMWRGGDGRS